MSLSLLPLEALEPLSRATDLLQLLERWVDRGWLRALDKAFVGFLYELDPQADPHASPSPSANKCCRSKCRKA